MRPHRTEVSRPGDLTPGIYALLSCSESFLIYVSDSWITHRFFFIWRDSGQWAMASSLSSFLDHTQTHHNRRRDLYLTTHKAHDRQRSMPPVEFEPTISTNERPKTYALDVAATGSGIHRPCIEKFIRHVMWFLVTLLLMFVAIDFETLG